MFKSGKYFNFERFGRYLMLCVIRWYTGKSSSHTAGHSHSPTNGWKGQRVNWCQAQSTASIPEWLAVARKRDRAKERDGGARPDPSDPSGSAKQTPVPRPPAQQALREKIIPPPSPRNSHTLMNNNEQRPEQSQVRDLPSIRHRPRS